MEKSIEMRKIFTTKQKFSEKNCVLGKKFSEKNCAPGKKFAVERFCNRDILL